MKHQTWLTTTNFISKLIGVLTERPARDGRVPTKRRKNWEKINRVPYFNQHMWFLISHSWQGLVNVPMFHITQLLGIFQYISSPRDIWLFCWCETNPPKGDINPNPWLNQDKSPFLFFQNSHYLQVPSIPRHPSALAIPRPEGSPSSRNRHRPRTSLALRCARVFWGKVMTWPTWPQTTSYGKFAQQFLYDMYLVGLRHHVKLVP